MKWDQYLQENMKLKLGNFMLKELLVSVFVLESWLVLAFVLALLIALVLALLLVLVASASNWQYWDHLVASGSLWQHLAASGSIWQHLAASGLAASGRT